MTLSFKNIFSILLSLSLLKACSIVVADNVNNKSTATSTDQISAKEVENYLSGKFNPAKHPAFVKVPQRYGNRSGYYLRAETFEAFKKMHAAAKKDGVNLVIRSATRNFDYQKRIWNRKWSERNKKIPDTKKRVLDILNYSAMPGTSRHHWGTEIDLNSFNNSWFTHGKGKKLFDWMNKNASKYGFYRPYTAKGKNRPSGYNEEKWHWSYAPLAIPMLKDAEGLLTDNKITGFYGSNHANSLSIVKKYIFGVDLCCR